MSSLAIRDDFLIGNGALPQNILQNPVEGLQGRPVEVLQPQGQAQPQEPRRNRCYNCCDKIKEVFKKVIEFLAYAVTTSENVQSVCKFGKSFIGFAKFAFKAQTAGFNNLREQFELVDGALDIADFLVDIKDWFVPKKDSNDSDQLKMFWNHKGMTKWKIVSKAVGTVSKTLGVVKFLMEVGLLKLGQISAYLNTIPFFHVVLQFSPLRVVKDSLTVISASLDVVHQGISVHAKRHDAHILDCKIDKWNAKEKLRSYLALTEEGKRISLERVLGNVAEPERELQYLNNLKSDYLRARVDLNARGITPRARPQENAPAVILRENLFENREVKWEALKLRYQDGALAAVNVTKYQEKSAEKITKLNNNHISQNKNYLAIVFQVAKIAAIVIGLVGVFASAIAGTVPFIIALSTAWFITSTLGMARLAYNFRYQNVA